MTRDEASRGSRAAALRAPLAEIGVAAFEQSPVSMVVYDADGRLLAVNPAFERLWGVRMEDAPSDYSVRRDAQLERQGVLPLIERAFAGEPVALPPIRYDIAAAAPTGRGRTLWTQAHLYALRDDGGRVERVVLTHEDVTARLEAEQELRGSEARFRAAVQATSDIVWTSDPDGRMVGEQHDWSEFTGQSREQYDGFGWADAVHPDDGRPTVDAWTAAVAARATFDFEHRLRRRDGVYRSFAIRAIPVLSEDGAVREWVGVHRDVTEERERTLALELQNGQLRDQAMELESQTQELQATTEELLQRTAEAIQARRLAEAANATKSDFLSKMSHELRTPLNAVGGYVDLLDLGLRGPVTEQQRSDFARIRRAQQYLLSLINDLLNFARLDAGQVDLRTTVVELGVLFDDLDALVGAQLLAKGIQYERVDPTPGALVRADHEKVRRILVNVLSNALKFTPPGGRVALSCVDDAAPTSGTGAPLVRIDVSDTGRGIPADRLESVFEPFVQLDRHLTHESQQGVGLGLAISRELARAMGGDLTAVSVAGGGTTFTLTLPRA